MVALNRSLRRLRHWRAAAAVAVVTVSGCATNPATGEREITLVSEAQEIQLGRQAAQEVEQTLSFVEEDALQAYVQRLGAQLAAASERPDLPWSFRVVDDPSPNAFALPGGFIYITRGMINLLDSEAELVAVLGHEIAHVTARHSAQAITRQQIAQLGVGVGSVFVPQVAALGDALGGGLQLLFLKYGRGAERQADELGFRYTLEQGYDVREFDDIFASLQRLGELEERSALPSWLATHPAPAERIREAQERLTAMGGGPPEARLGRAEFLGQIDGLVFGENPRNGFFREGVFYHPDLRFRFALPRDWKTQNLARAVMAVSPRNDAAVQLTLAQQQGAAQALRAFLSQQGIQAGQTARETVNGIPVAYGYFQAQTQQGVLRGLVAYLEYGGRTYQLVSYAPAAAFGQYETLFRQILQSFAPLADPQILNIQPDRIDIVRLDRNMNLAEFNRRFPSAVPLERLVVINQVADANEELPAGTLVKRVVAGSATPA